MAVDLKAAKFSGNKIRNLQFTLGLKKVKRNKGSQERIENIERSNQFEKGLSGT